MDPNITMPATTRTTLLGLPSELRLEIYRQVCQLTVDIQPLRGFRLIRRYPRHPRHPLRLRGSYISVKEFRESPAHFHTPWQDLMRCSKTIAEELRHFMESSSFLDEDQNRTYVIDLEPTGGLVSVIWRKLPCRQQHVRDLIINVRRAARATISTLNLFIHSGAPLDRTKPLAFPLALQKLRVNVLVDQPLILPESAPGLEMDERANIIPELQTAHDLLSAHHKIGHFGGSLRRVQLRERSRIEEEFDVVYPFRAATVNGIQWGL
jgi:hypothetical protein